MSERKWTPGPWTVKRERGIRAQGGQNVASVYFSAPKADTHLIAAAPDLYEALERAISCQPQDDSCEAWVGDARRALAKARGEA